MGGIGSGRRWQFSARENVLKPIHGAWGLKTWFAKRSDR